MLNDCALSWSATQGRPIQRETNHGYDMNLPIKAEVISELERLESLVEAWDDLAVSQSRPRSAPAWVISWYRHVLPRRARPRVIVVWDGETLAGVMPLFVHRDPLGLFKYQLAGTHTLYGVEPLVRPGAFEDVSAVLGVALASVVPRPDIVEFDCMVDVRPWLQGVATQWPRRDPEVADRTSREHLTKFGDGFEPWLESKTPMFRKNLRRGRRDLGMEGLRPAVHLDAQSVIERLPALARQYESRKGGRGGEGMKFDARVCAMISDAVTRLSGSGRVCLATWEKPGTVAVAHLAMGAGRELSAWVCGFDPAVARASPGIVNLATLFEHAAGAGYSVVDLGPGEEPYKLRFANSERDLQRTVLSGRNRWPLHSPVQLLSLAHRHALVDRLRRSTVRIRRGEIVPRR